MQFSAFQCHKLWLPSQSVASVIVIVCVCVCVCVYVYLYTLALPECVCVCVYFCVFICMHFPFICLCVCVFCFRPQCDNLLALLRTLENEAPLSQVSGLEQEISQLTAWSSGVTERRQQAQEKVLALARAVERIEQHTSSITRDMNAKVAAVRTDIRRMGGLESDVESLLARTGELEDKASEVERTMIKRMGELLVGSIDRVTSLKSATERNAQRLEQMRKQTPELLAADRRLSERILALESGRARLMRTVTFAGDLKPKVFTIQRDFTALEPRLDDLTLRIGQLAEHVMKSEKDLGELSESLASLSVAQGGVTELLVEQVVAMTSDPNNQPTHTSNLTEPVDVSLPSGEQ